MSRQDDPGAHLSSGNPLSEPFKGDTLVITRAAEVSKSTPSYCCLMCLIVPYAYGMARRARVSTICFNLQAALKLLAGLQSRTASSIPCGPYTLGGVMEVDLNSSRRRTAKYGFVYHRG